MPKLTRNAQYFIIGAMVMIIVLVGFILSPKDNEEEIPSQETVIVVKENITIKADYITEVSKEQGSEIYTPCEITVKKNEEIQGYKISENQSFTKYIQLTGPNGKEVLTNKSQQVITHYAYSCLLIGDIIEKTVGETKTYEIVNARVTYNRIPFALLENENKACIRNNDKDEVKMLNLTEFKEGLGDIEKRKDIISW